MQTKENDEMFVFKHCHICKHPLKEGEYMVVNDTFPNIPPYFGKLSQCKNAANCANNKSEELLNKLINKAKKDGYSEDEIKNAVEKLLFRKSQKML